MDKENLLKMAITGGVLFAVYKFVPNAAVRAAVLGVAGVVAVRNVPFVNQYVGV